MQEEKVAKFKKVVGELISDIRKSETDLSINKFALEYELDKSNISKIERGKYGINLISAWKICQALGIKFSYFAKLLEERLGEDFTLIDE